MLNRVSVVESPSNHEINIAMVYPVVTPGILSRVFLFYFEKISSHSDLFQVFWKIPAEIQDLASMKFVLKKKKVFLKSKQICIPYTEKSQNGKKKNENKRNEQSYLYNKL